MLSDVSRKSKAAIAALEELVAAVEAAGIGLGALGDAKRARGHAAEVLKSVRFAQFAEVLEPGDMVMLPKVGSYGRLAWLRDRERVLGVERQGYGSGPGWYEPADVNLVCVEELERQVAYLKKHVEEWAGKPGRDKSAPERLAGYERQLERLRAKAAA